MESSQDALKSLDLRGVHSAIGIQDYPSQEGLLKWNGCAQPATMVRTRVFIASCD
jgi:hypothetical protein